MTPEDLMHLHSAAFYARFCVLVLVEYQSFFFVVPILYVLSGLSEFFLFLLCYFHSELVFLPLKIRTAHLEAKLGWLGAHSVTSAGREAPGNRRQKESGSR